MRVRTSEAPLVPQCRRAGAPSMPRAVGGPWCWPPNGRAIFDGAGNAFGTGNSTGAASLSSEVRGIHGWVRTWEVRASWRSKSWQELMLMARMLCIAWRTQDGGSNLKPCGLLINTKSPPSQGQHKGIYVLLSFHLIHRASCISFSFLPFFFSFCMCVWWWWQLPGSHYGCLGGYHLPWTKGWVAQFWWKNLGWLAMMPWITCQWKKKDRLCE